jgi:hypothetical protein
MQYPPASSGVYGYLDFGNQGIFTTIITDCLDIGSHTPLRFRVQVQCCPSRVKIRHTELNSAFMTMFRFILVDLLQPDWADWTMTMGVECDIISVIFLGFVTIILLPRDSSPGT